MSASLGLINFFASRRFLSSSRRKASSSALAVFKNESSIYGLESTEFSQNFFIRHLGNRYCYFRVDFLQFQLLALPLLLHQPCDTLSQQFHSRRFKDHSERKLHIE